MSLLIAFAAAAVLSGAQAATPPSGHADEVVVKARKAVVVTAYVCPPPDPARYPADRAPRVVDSYPAQGSVVAPGFVRVRVSFDAPMSCLSEVTTDGGETDPCQHDGTWELPARQSFIMQCRLEPSVEYHFRFGLAEGRRFVGMSGQSAGPYDLDFTSSAGPAVTSASQAAALDPGPPGAVGVFAYVICADAPAAPGRRDCHRTSLRPPGE